MLIILGLPIVSGFWLVFTIFVSYHFFDASYIRNNGGLGSGNFGEGGRIKEKRV